MKPTPRTWPSVDIPTKARVLPTLEGVGIMIKQPCIIRIDITQVRVPLRPESLGPYEAAQSNPWHLAPFCLFEVHTDDGLVGLGEAGPHVTLSQAVDEMRPLIGMRVAGLGLQITSGPYSPPPNVRLRRFPPSLFDWTARTGNALETALLDLAGKRLGCSAVDVLGGAYRERVAVDWWCHRQTPQGLANEARMAQSRGFTGIKTKSIAGDRTEEHVAAVAEAVGKDFRIVIDPMMQWIDPLTALDTITRIERIGAAVRLEDPFPHHMPELWRRLRQVSTIPLIWHARDLSILTVGLREQCADGFNIAGGHREFLTLAHAIEVAGYACWHGSGLEMGVTQVARLHAAAAARACELPSDLSSALVREHTLITWDWPFENGYLPLPPGPGLGIELDRHAIEKYCESRTSLE